MSLSTPVPQIVEQSTDLLLGAHPSWKRAPLHTVARVQNGYPFPSSAFVSGNPDAGTPLIRIRDVMRHRTDTTFVGDYDPAFLVEPGSLLIGMDGDFNTAIWQGPPALLNQRVCRINVDERSYDTKFLSYVLPGYLRAINAATSSITVKHLSSRSVEAIPLPLPPLPEQHRIVAAIETHLTRLDAAVAALERARARLKRYRAAVLKAACEGRLVPTEAALARTEGRPYEPAPALLARIQEERTAVGAHGRAPARRQQLPASLPANLPDPPEGWTWATLDQLLAKLRNGISAKPDAGEDGIRILRINAVRPMRVDMREVRYLRATDHDYTDYGLQVGDLLFTRYNGSPDLVGVCAAVHSVPAFTVHPDKVIVGRVHEVNPHCLEVFLNTGESRAHIARNTKTTAGQAGISGSDLRITPIPVPPLAEQERIVAEVERRLSVIDQLDATVTANLKRSDALRQSVLRRAFSGQLVPPEEQAAHDQTPTHGCVPCSKA